MFRPVEHTALDYLAEVDLPHAIRVAAGTGHQFESAFGRLRTAEECRAVAAAIGAQDGAHQMVRHGGGSDGSNRVYSGSFDGTRFKLATRWKEIDPDGYRQAVAAGEFDPG